MVFKILTALAVSFFVFIITQVGLQTWVGQYVSIFISSIPLADKTIHFGMMVVMSYLFGNALKQRRVNILGHELLFSSLLLAIGITLEECSQIFIPSRNFEILDMVCNYAGIYLGSLFTGGPILKHLTDADHLRSETLSIQTIRHSAGPLHHESGHGRRSTRRLVRHHGRR